jgi:hypothetical protein
VVERQICDPGFVFPSESTHCFSGGTTGGGLFFPGPTGNFPWFGGPSGAVFDGYPPNQEPDCEFRFDDVNAFEDCIRARDEHKAGVISLPVAPQPPPNSLYQECTPLIPGCKELRIPFLQDAARKFSDLFIRID